MINDDEGMNNALEYYREKDNNEVNSYWGDWTDEDPYSNVDSAEEYDEEEGWKDDYDDYDTYDDDYDYYDYEDWYYDYDDE